MKYFMPSNVYDILKWVGLVAIPALALFYGAVAPIWGWPAPEGVVTTLNALGTLLGALIGISHVTATEEGTQDAN